MSNTADKINMAKNLKVVPKLLHLWHTIIGSKLRVEVGKGLHWKEDNQEDTSESKQGSKKSVCLKNNLGLFSVGVRSLNPERIILVNSILKNTVTLAPNDNFRSKRS